MEVKNINTYEGPYLYTCFWMALIPILRGMGIAEENILLNIVPILERNPEGKIKFRGKLIETLRNIFAEYGIISEIYSGEDLYNFLKRNIDCDKPVIVNVDCFYMDYIQGHYGKSHMPHCLLVYGYDGNKLKVIDHSYATGLQYVRREVPYDVLHDGYFKNQVGKIRALSFDQDLEKRQSCNHITERLQNIKGFFEQERWYVRFVEILNDIQKNIHSLDDKTVFELYQFGMGLVAFQFVLNSVISDKCREQLEEFCSAYLLLRTSYYKICHTSRYKTEAYYEKTKILCQQCCEAGERWYKTFMEEI